MRRERGGAWGGARGHAGRPTRRTPPTARTYRWATATLLLGLLAGTALPADAVEGVGPRNTGVAPSGASPAGMRSPATLSGAADSGRPRGPGASDADAYPVRVTLDALSPVWPKDGDTLTVRGQLVNTTRRPITGGRLGVRVDGVARAAAGAQYLDPLAPGEKRSFTLRLPVVDLGLGAAAVHSFGVGLTTSGGVLAGLGRTRFPWAPDGVDGDPLDVAVLWPVTDTPHAEAVSLGWGDSAQPVFRDDALAGSFGTGGRLRELVDAADGLPVTWTVDPALLDEARSMAGGYRVADVRDAGDPQRSRPGTGQAAATSWLGAMRTAVKNQDVVALPYADPDVATLAHRRARGGTGNAARTTAAEAEAGGARGSAAPGALTGALAPVLRESVRWGRTATAAALGGHVRDDIVWPYGGALDAGITGVAASMGSSVFIASGHGLSTGSSLSHVSLGDGASALVGDPAATSALSGPSESPSDLLAARQHLMAALLRARLSVGKASGPAGGAPAGSDGTDGSGATDEGGGATDSGAVGGDLGDVGLTDGGAVDGGGLLVVPPRQMTGAMARVLSSVLESARDAGWVRLVGLDDLGSGTSDDLSVAAVAGAPAVAARTRPGSSGAGRGGGGHAGPGGGGGAGFGGRAEAGERAAGGAGASGKEGRNGGYPQGLRAGELSADDLSAVAAIQPDLGTLIRVLSDPGRTTDTVHRAMLRALSTGWRVAGAGGDVEDQRSYTGGVRAYVDNSIASVQLLPKHGTVTLAGDAASVPITVSNGLQQPLGGLELKVLSSAPNRVTVAHPATPVEAPPASNHTEQVKVRAYANGPVEMTAQLYTTSNHRPWGRPIAFRVKVSRMSPLVVGVIASGAFLVLLAGAVQARRVRRRDGRPPTAPVGRG